jgi:hypothetical protein
MNYRIIGDDGRTYGPATTEQLREWIAQKRVNQRTPVLVEGGADWTMIGLLPEFADTFAPPPRVASQPAGPLRTNSLAVWGFVFGLLSCTCCSLCCCGCPLNVVGLVLSIIGLIQINANPDTQQGKGYAIAGIVCSGLSLVSWLGCSLLDSPWANWEHVWHLNSF